MHVLVTPIGTGGDVLPFVGIGRALAQRGHQVTVAANDHFEPLVRGAGLAFSAVGAASQYLAVLDGPLVANSRRGLPQLMRYVAGGARALYQTIAAFHRRGPVAVLAPPLGFAARVAGERLGVPTATVYLSPAALQSAHEPPVQPGIFNPRWMPRWYKRSIWWAVDRLILDRAVGPTVNGLRAEVGLAPVRRLFEDGWRSTQPFFGLFPDWFAPRQPDWPLRFAATGFPLYDDDAAAPDAEVQAFLDGGEPPLVFTPGSGNRHARAFFAAAVEACRRLGRRALLLTRFADQLPSSLPAGVRHFAYVPLSRCLPRAAAIVHHGGIGTAAQALAAGVPQLIMPMAYDQPDNAARLARLGVAVALPPRRFRAATVAAALSELTASCETAAQCRVAAGRMRAGDGIAQVCAQLEEVWK